MNYALKIHIAEGLSVSQFLFPFNTDILDASLASVQRVKNIISNL